MRKTLIILFLMSLSSAFSKNKEVTLYWVHTSDVHSSIFCFDYLKNKPTKGGLSAVYAYVDSLRKEHPGHVICTDGGDALQGQPTAYYFNFIDTVSPHLITQMMNEMKYDAGAVGNHDIETGHAVYDRWFKEVNFPMLGANIIDQRTGKTYLPPYTIVKRDGIKIAILGMITPAIPSWLPKVLWTDLEFQDMVKSTRYWIEKIQKKEKPHLIVGLFHSGLNGGIVTDEYIENATEMVAKEVPGLDMIVYGHDHMYAVNNITNVNGDNVTVIGPTSMAARVAQAEIHLTLSGNRVVKKEIFGSTPLITGANSEQTLAIEKKYAKERETLLNWIDQPIGVLDSTIQERDGYFGPSKFIDLVHQLQLGLTGADISFAAPLSYDSRLEKGNLTIRDMFRLYKYENFLYTMSLTGKEIKGFLEMSYALWTNHMIHPEDHIMLLDTVMNNGRRKGFVNMAFNFDSAAGIIYTVDVTKPEGEKINILRMADGRPFDMNAKYTVAVNSYRGNGGGELLTRGAGISHNELPKRIIKSTVKDLRYYLIEYVKEKKVISAKCLHQWRFIPDEWAIPAIKRDRLLLFPDENEQ